MKKLKKRLLVGPVSGQHFESTGSLVVAKKLTQVSAKGKVLKEGLLFSRKWMFDSRLFEENPTAAWAKEHWIEWRKF